MYNMDHVYTKTFNLNVYSLQQTSFLSMTRNNRIDEESIAD